MENTRLKIEAGDFLKRTMISKGLGTHDIAKKLGVSQSSVSTTLRKNRMTMGTFVGILKICEEPFVVKLSTGEEVELEISDKE